MLHPDAEQNREQVGTSFVGTFREGPDQALIVLSGDIDAAVTVRLQAHVDTVLGVRARFLTIDASAVTRYDPGLLDLLGRTQRRLARYHGLLGVRGLHPDQLPAAESPVRSVPLRSAPDRVAAGVERAPQVAS